MSSPSNWETSRLAPFVEKIHALNPIHNHVLQPAY